ncbi:hypothetical protein CPT_Moabite_246 [Serratia phage Moabite]|uniref:Uncharacterized protein n=1 Tax=Serratia phage Moabite TaxID=2587814 RepID=A0A4Y5TPK1_9CAUD|nr:hypothetical protein HWC48_gp170 [Serratia phage Moabite]QDB71276.1 hypothetical protein CPT_Moabite_246 [Serratia phage Moabite]UGO54128.1 hypothetical protein HAYMO_146 [Serratia phage vB_SmaM_Haymo]
MARSVLFIAIPVIIVTAVGYYQNLTANAKITSEIESMGYKGINLMRRTMDCSRGYSGEIFTGTSEKNERVYAAFCTADNQPPFIEVIRNSGEIK